MCSGFIVMEKKICAMVRQTWYETAKKNLKPEERLRFYELCLEYEFFNQEPDEDAPFASRLLFDMVRNDIDKDKQRAQERAERNRQNGMRGGRPKVTADNETNENPEKPSGLFGNPNTKQYNTIQNNTQQCENEDSHMFFNVCLDFFERGCSQPVEEARKFWGYYEGLGWKTKGGGEIVNKMAVAKAWRLPDCSKAAMRNRMAYADLMHKANPVEICLIEDFVSCKRFTDPNMVIIQLQERSTCLLLDAKYMDALKAWIPKDQDGNAFGLEYRAMNTTIE